MLKGAEWIRNKLLFHMYSDYPLYIIICNRNVRITSPQIDSVFILLKHSQLYTFFHVYRKQRGNLGPYNSLYTQQ